MTRGGPSVSAQQSRLQEISNIGSVEWWPVQAEADLSGEEGQVMATGVRATSRRVRLSGRTGWYRYRAGMGPAMITAVLPPA